MRVSRNVPLLISSCQSINDLVLSESWADSLGDFMPASRHAPSE